MIILTILLVHTLMHVNVIDIIGRSTNDDGKLNQEEYSQRSWTVDTKYYTALVEFWIDSTDPDPDSETGETDEMSTKELHESLAPLVDAIIFVFDPTRVKLFKKLEILHKGISIWFIITIFLFEFIARDICLISIFEESLQKV